jgi:iron complex transport system ATP-binding protein
MGGPERSPCLRLEEVHVGARLQGVSLDFARGDCCVVVGPNGAGKSTLLRTLLGLERVDRGSVLLDARPLQEFTPGQRAAHVAWLPQRPRLGESLRVDELVASARYRFGEARGQALAHARRALAEVGAESLAERQSDRISGGELQRVLLAALLAQEAPLLLVDEPANHLDPAQQVAIYRRLGALRERGLGLLVVTHDINLAGLLGPAERVRVLGLLEGRIALDSALSAPDLPERLSELYRVHLTAVQVNGARFLLVDHDAPHAGFELDCTPEGP